MSSNSNSIKLYSETRNDLKYLKSKFQPIYFGILAILMEECNENFNIVFIIANYLMYTVYMTAQGIKYEQTHDWLNILTRRNMNFFWIEPFNRTVTMWRNKVEGEPGYINEQNVTWTYSIILRVDLYIALDFIIQELDLDYEYAVCTGNVNLATSIEDWAFLFGNLTRILHMEPESKTIVFEKYSMTVDDYRLYIEDAEEFGIEPYNYSLSRLWKNNILEEHCLSRKVVNFRITYYNTFLDEKRKARQIEHDAEEIVEKTAEA